MFIFYVLDENLHIDYLPRRLQSVCRIYACSQGEGILSWTGNDNFVVEDITTATPEVIAFLLFRVFIYTEQENITVKNHINSLFSGPLIYCLMSTGYHYVCYFLPVLYFTLVYEQSISLVL